MTRGQPIISSARWWHWWPSRSMRLVVLPPAGGTLPPSEGRLSLNPPLPTFDLLGTLCMVFAGVGWQSRSPPTPHF